MHIVEEHLKLRHECSTCNQMFNLKSSLTNHVRNKHKRLRPRENILCDCCGKSFMNTLSLQRHVASRVERSF
ncbi:hypothetical protein O3G_MSEX011654 [Manduca sexta]|uniref:C2H2-type domain-containing protein n=2 Tax=Manduca sexta TaxID=7130 RepID=A0A921ZMG9_MANSE|nr:hypothetical protein O3G_MSEX011654 [Manduca sexta]